MIPEPESLGEPDETTSAELLGWRPEHGVLSLSIRIDRADRSEGWRTEVRNGLSAAGGSPVGEREARQALRATIERVEREILEQDPRGEHPGLFGFVEVTRNEGEERWLKAQIAPRRTEVLHAPRAQIRPLLELLDDGAPLGVAAVAAERVRLLDWRLGRAEQLHDWGLEYFGLDWRERKARKPRDPARGSAVAAAGRDQHDQRLESNRERFAEQAGELARAESKANGWRQLLLFGDERYVRKFSNGFAEVTPVRHVDGADLISDPSNQIERRVEKLLPQLNRERERSLIDRVKEAAYAEGRSALGVDETLQALEQGRVERLLYDADRDHLDTSIEPNRKEAGGLPLIERMIELALSTGAAVTPVEGESARALDEQNGAIALLRY